jgi:hypothetical protein
MKNTLKINHEKGTITMDRTFAKKAENTMSAEYAHLQNVRRDYPTYTVVRREIKKNPNKECYKGLTYEYMENYITTHEEGENRVLVLKEFAEMRLISECHSKAHRYPVIKKWFLDKYPEIANFGMAAPATEESPDTQSNKIIPMPQNNTELDKVSGIN